MVSNNKVVADIKQIQSDPDLDYGYKKMTTALMLLGFVINHKKVYRLMNENLLLKPFRKKGFRNFVKYRKVFPKRPLEMLEMDIKFQWVEQHKRHAYIITVIDTFTRVVLAWKVSYSIKQHQVKKLWDEIIVNHLQPYNCLEKQIKIEIRNDNDSRFTAKKIKKYFEENNLIQVFTHPYTPQENGHIESFHAILGASLKRFEFWSLEDLEKHLILFYEKYNNKRLHSSVLNLPPYIFWLAWEKGLVETKFNEKTKKMKHKLKIPYWQLQLSGNSFRREVPCSKTQVFDNTKVNPLDYEMYSAETLLQPSV